MAKNKGVDWKRVVVDTLYLRDGGLCGLCQREIGPDNLFEIDHIQEVKDGGLDVMENLRLVHLMCHKARHQANITTVSPEVFKAAQMVRATAAMAFASRKATVKTEINRIADKNFLTLIKNAYRDTGSITKAAASCGMNYDALHYFKTKHRLQGKPDTWEII